MKKKMLAKCLEWLKRKEFKHEIHEILTPVLEVVIQSIWPYMFYIFAAVAVIIGLLLLILVLMLQKKTQLII